MKRILVLSFILAGIIISGAHSESVYAVDNVTAVSSDNFTIQTPDVQTLANNLLSMKPVIQSVSDNIKVMADNIVVFNNTITGIAASFMALIFVLALAILAHWDREQGGYYLAGVALILFGFIEIPTIKWLCILFIAGGFYQMYKGKNSP